MSRKTKSVRMCVNRNIFGGENIKNDDDDDDCVITRLVGAICIIKHNYCGQVRRRNESVRKLAILVIYLITSAQ